MMAAAVADWADQQRRQRIQHAALTNHALSPVAAAPPPLLTVSNDTRVRMDGFVKIMARLFPAKGL